MSASQTVKNVRPLMWGLGVVLVVLLLLVWRANPWGSSADDSASGSLGGAEVGFTEYPAGERTPAPTVEGTTLEGDSLSLADYTGHIVVVNVWGSWCGPCRAETPELVRLANEHKDQGVRFLGIDTRDSRAAAQAFVRRFKVPYPSLFDADGRVLLPLTQLVPSAAVPSTLVVDADGNVAARIIGRVTYSTLNGLLDDLEGESR